MGRGANDLSLGVLLRVDDSQASKIRGFGSVIGGLGGPLGLATAAMAAFGAISIGVIAQSVQVAAQYQQSMNMVQALTGASQAQMAQYDVGLKQLAIDSGVAPLKLSQGLYYVISSGYQGAAAMKLLTLSTRDAVIGMTDQSTTASALTTVMQGFNKSITQADAVNGEMLRTVTLGKMTMHDYAGAISKVAVLHAQYKVTLEDTNATLATLTSSGYKSAAIAATGYSALVGIMDGKTDLMTKRIHKLGLNFDEAHFKTLSYSGQLAYLNQTMAGHYDQLQNVLGGSKQASSAFTTLETHSAMFTSNLKALSDQQKNASATQAAWNITQGGFSQTMNRLNAAFNVLEINIGSLFLPILTRLVNALIPVVVFVANFVLQLASLDQMFSEKLSPAVKVFSEAIFYVGYYFDRQLRPAVKLLTDEFNVLWGQLANPGQLNDTFKQTTDWMINVGTPAYTAYSHVVGDVLGGSYQKLAQDARDALGATAQAGKQIGQKVAVSISDSLKNIKIPGFGTGGGILQQIFGSVEQLNQTLQGIEQFFGRVGQFFSSTFGPFVSEWNQMMKDLQPDFTQYAIWWKTVMQPLLDQLSGAQVHPSGSVSQIGSPVKGALDIIRGMIEGVIRLGLNLQEVILPTIVKLLIWIKQTGMGISNWIQTNGPNVLSFFQGLADATQQINNNIAGLGNIGNIFSWIGQHNPFGGPQNQGTGTNLPPVISSIPGFGGVGKSIPSFASGVTDFIGGLAYVHQDELLANLSPGTNVFTASQTRGMLGGGGYGGSHTVVHQPIVINISMSGRPSRADLEGMADDLSQILAKKMRGNANIQVATSGSVRS